MDRTELLAQITLALIQKSGVREWEQTETQTAIAAAAVAIVDGLLGITPPLDDDMGLPDYLRTSTGTALTLQNSGGTAAITLASLANGNGTSAGGRQSATLDFGTSWAREWRVEFDFELAATPTAGNAINLFASWHDATGAGDGNTSGSDAAYTGYSNNIDAATRQLELLGAAVVTGQATSTVQRALVGIIRPKARYANIVVDNRSGAAFHSTNTNQVIRFVPLEESIVDTI
jgi:hypothetical protein